MTFEQQIQIKELCQKRVARQNGEEAIEVARLIQASMCFRIAEARANTML